MSKSSRYIIAIHEYSRSNTSYDFTCYFYIEKCENNTKRVMFFGNRKSENFSEISFSFSYRDDVNIYILVNFIKKILNKKENTHSLHLYIVENDFFNIINSSIERITFKYISGLEKNNILKPITTYNDNNIMLFDDIKMLLQFIITTDDAMIDFV
jgi:uncharacterized protein YejL (UPF0352 family)